MGWRWYFHNETLDVYYDIGSDDLTYIQNDLKKVLGIHGWSLDHVLSFKNERDYPIPYEKVLGQEHLHTQSADPENSGHEDSS